MFGTFPIRQMATAALGVAFVSGGAIAARAGNSVVHGANRPAAAAAKNLIPLSPAWRKNYMLRHGFITHVGNRGILAPATSGKYLYVADYNLSVIFVFDAASTANPAPLGFISDGVTYPTALAVDSNDNLYVANEGNSTVTVYAPGRTVASKSFSTIFPLAMALGPDGALYVGGETANTNLIEVFPASGKPYTVGSPNDEVIGGIAVRPTNVVTVSVNDANSNGTIDVYPNGITKAPLQVAGANGGLLEGLSYDPAGYVYASNFSTNGIYIYAPGSYTQTFIYNGVAGPIGNTFADAELFVANSGAPDATAYTSVTASPITFSKNLTFPTAVAVSAAGLSTAETTIYTVQECNCSEVDVYNTALPHPTRTATIAQGVIHPSGVALDDAGDIYTANYGTHVVTELAAGTHKPKAFLSVSNPFGVAVDHLGTVYVSDQGAGAVEIFEPGKSKPAGAFSCNNTYNVQHLTVDKSNNVFVACGNDVLEYNPSTKTSVLLGLTGLQYATGVAVDAEGNLYVADELNNQVPVFAPKATSPSRVITNGMHEPYAVHVGASGKLYVANLSTQTNPIYAPNGSTPIGSINGVNLEDITTGR